MRWTNKKAIKIPPIILVIAGIFLVGLLVYFGLHGCRFLGLLIFGADALLACYYCLFKIKKPACLAGNEQNGLAAMAVDLEFHIPVQVIRVFFVVSDVHWNQPSAF